jgi:ABC-type sulfate transport system substrate-binding protein
MIQGIFWAQFWVNGAFNSGTLTVRIPKSQVTAQASLARISYVVPSEGQPIVAQAYILKYCMDDGGRELCIDYFKLNVPFPSVITSEQFPKVTSVTFKLDVINGFAWCIGLVFLHA